MSDEGTLNHLRWLAWAAGVGYPLCRSEIDLIRDAADELETLSRVEDEQAEEGHTLGPVPYCDELIYKMGAEFRRRADICGSEARWGSRKAYCEAAEYVESFAYYPPQKDNPHA